MAYIYMPLIFTVMGYLLAFITLQPILEMLQAVGSMVIAKEEPDFDRGLVSIYDPEVTVVEKDIVYMKDIVFPEYETCYGNVSCERIGLDAPVYWGDTKAILKVGAGNYMGSFMPGFGRPILLSAHNTTYFRPFKDIIEGDVILYKTNYGTFEYKVTKTEVINAVVAEGMMDDILSGQEEQLIMYTCYPFQTLVGGNKDRLFVFAEKISGPTVE